MKNHWGPITSQLAGIIKLENIIDCIIARNAEDYEKSIIPVYSPTELLKML